MLRDREIRTSKAQTLRIMRENSLLAHTTGSSARPQGARRCHQDRSPGRDVGKEMTTALTTEDDIAMIFFTIAHFSLESLGIHAAARDTRFEAWSPCASACGTDSGRSAETSPAA